MSWDPKRGGFYCDKCDANVCVSADQYHATFTGSGKTEKPSALPPALEPFNGEAFWFCGACARGAYEAVRAYCADLPAVLAERKAVAIDKRERKDARASLERTLILLRKRKDGTEPPGYAGSQMAVEDGIRAALRSLEAP